MKFSLLPNLLYIEYKSTKYFRAMLTFKHVVVIHIASLWSTFDYGLSNTVKLICFLIKKLFCAMVTILRSGVKYLIATAAGVLKHSMKVPAFQMVQHIALAEMTTKAALVFAKISSTINFRVLSAKL